MLSKLKGETKSLNRVLWYWHDAEGVEQLAVSEERVTAQNEDHKGMH